MADTTQPYQFSVAVGYDRDGTAHMALEGELDIASLAGLRRLFEAARGDDGRLVLDLRRLRFVDLPGVRLLLELSQRRGCEVEGATGQVARLIDFIAVRARQPVAI